MRLITPVLAAALAAASAVAGSAALAQYDPAASRAENQVNAINRSIQGQQQSRATQQQNQFESNALRTELSRPAPSLPTPVGPGIAPGGVRR